jgi:hypothetical protein
MEIAKCPTNDEWIKKMWYLYTMEFYSTPKKNEILSLTSKWMELENIILIFPGSKGQKLHVLFICRLQTQNKCSNIIGHGSYTEGRTLMGGLGKRKET